MKNKNIIVGIGGGIAAYKSIELVRLLKKAGANVQVVLTESAKAFVTPMTLQVVSGVPVRDDVFSLEAEQAMGHIELARWADLIVVAPATANLLAKLANGIADNLLTTICLATESPIALVPAMNEKMWHHQATQENLKRLIRYQYHIWGPAEGEQACGDVGLGRMLEPLEILTHIGQQLTGVSLSGKCFVITAGPTQEAIDPVRCLTNFSSGKMGYALAKAAADQGAKVILISGPVHLTPPDGVTCVQVVSADEMCQAVFEVVDQADIFIGAAAVADYRPVAVSDKKIKKTASTRTIELTPNPDIIAKVSLCAHRPQCVVGFAAQTHDMLKYAQQKLRQKKLDLIIANQVGDGLAFGADVNEVTLIKRDGTEEKLPMQNKSALARKIIDFISLL